LQLSKNSLLWFIPFVIYLLHASIYGLWLIDDAGITFAYSRNFIHGFGLVAQPGVPPVEGYSNPSWMLFLSPIFLWVSNPVWLVKIISVSLVGLGFFLVTKLAVMSNDRSLIGPVIFSLIMLALTPGFTIWTVSGLENSLLFLLAVTLLFVICLDDCVGSSLIIILAFITFFVAITRPEAILYAGVYPLFILLKYRDLSFIKPSIIYSAAFLVLVSLFLLYRWHVFQEWLPNTYFAKVHDKALGEDIIKLTKRFYKDIWAPLYYPVILFSLYSLYILVRKSKNSFILAVVAFFVFSWLCYGLLPRDWMPEYRFATVFFLFTFLVVSLGVNELIKNTKIKLGVYTAILLVASYNQLPRAWEFSKKDFVSFESVASQFGFRFNFYRDVIGEEYASLLAPDLGGTLYYSKLRVYDLAGLCDRDIAKTYYYDDQVARTKLIFEEIRPTFIHAHMPWSANLGADAKVYIMADYEVIHGGINELGFPEGDFIRKDAISNLSELDKLKAIKLDKQQYEAMSHSNTSAYGY